jgi:hypothetical protein
MTRARAVGAIRRRGRWLVPSTVAGSVVLTGTLAAAAPSSPAPAAVSGFTGELNAVSAVSASDAWAVGATGRFGMVPLIVHWDGGSWSRVQDS